MESPRAHGFTLIEIIVSVTLLLVLSGLFMASYTGFNSSQTVKQAASSLIGNLQAVRTKASSGVKPAGCDTLVGYAVEFTADAYTASAVCQDGDEYPPVTYTLPSNVTFSPIPDSVTFYALNRGASADQTITITRAGTTMKMKVSVFTSGVVSDYILTTCVDYCQSLGTYTTGTCRNNSGRCTLNGETYKSGGDQYCPSGKVCCCHP